MALSFITDIDLSGNEIQNFGLQTLASDPTGFAGRAYFNTADNKIRVHNGTSWAEVGVTYTASSGLTLVGNDFQIATSGVTAIKLASDAVETAKIKDDAVTYAKIQGTSVNTVLGNITGDNDSVQELSPAQIRTLINVEDGAEVNVQSDWDATSGDALILNKPTLGTLAALNSVNGATITDNSVSAAELNVSGNGSAGQVLTSDGDGSFSWTAKTINTDEDVSVANLATRLSQLDGGIQIGSLAGDEVRIVGNLRVDGTTTTVNSETVTIADNIILLNSNATVDENGGIEIERGTDPNTQVLWNASSNRWTFTNDGTTYYNIPVPSEYAVGDITAVTAGNGLTGGGTSGAVTLNIGAGAGIAVSADEVEVIPASLLNLGGIKLGSDTVQNVAANSVSATASRTYALQVNSSGQAVVNVPWVDTNTNTQLSQEQVQDYAAPLLDHSNHSGISASYVDASNRIDLTTQNNFVTIDISGWAGGDYAIEDATAGVRVPAIMQLYNQADGRMVMAETGFAGTEHRIYALPAGDWTLVMQGRRT